VEKDVKFEDEKKVDAQVLVKKTLILIIFVNAGLPTFTVNLYFYRFLLFENL